MIGEINLTVNPRGLRRRQESRKVRTIFSFLFHGNIYGYDFEYSRNRFARIDCLFKSP